MTDNTHLIQRQTIELELPRSGSMPFEAQQWLETVLEQKVYPRLEPLFDQFAGEDQWLDIDRLDIDLGEIFFKQEDNAWITQVYEQFKSALQRRVSSPPEGSIKTRVDLGKRSLDWFLLHGYLAWWSDASELDKLAREQISTQPHALLTLLKSPSIRMRWTQQFDTTLQNALLHALSIRPPISLQHWLALFEERWHSRAAILYWQSIWELACESGTSIQETALQRRLIKNLQQNSGDISWKSLQWEKLALEDKWLGIAEKISKKTGGLSNGQESFPGINTVTLENVDSIYISLAGTVLVHPFLPTLFERLKFLHNDRFINFSAQERAVHLLYYIATQQQHPMETEVVLFKLLCGLPLNAPVARTVDLKPSETNEADRMLAALIEHWPAIQGTTPEELRASFFLREGKLDSNDLGWQLTVEQNSFDVLLSKLNWGLSPILHPWMERSVWVNWA